MRSYEKHKNGKTAKIKPIFIAMGPYKLDLWTTNIANLINLEWEKTAFIHDLGQIFEQIFVFNVVYNELSV